MNQARDPDPAVLLEFRGWNLDLRNLLGKLVRMVDTLPFLARCRAGCCEVRSRAPRFRRGLLETTRAAQSPFGSGRARVRSAWLRDYRVGGGGGGGVPAGGGGTAAGVRFDGARAGGGGGGGGGVAAVAAAGAVYAGTEPRATGTWLPLAYMHCTYAMS